MYAAEISFPPPSAIIEYYREVPTNTGKYIEYVIRVKSEGHSWSVSRRYKEFAYLNQHLSCNYSSVQFPPKQWMGRYEKDFLNNRQKALQDYLESLVNSPLVDKPIMQQFLRFDELERARRYKLSFRVGLTPSQLKAAFHLTLNDAAGINAFSLYLRNFHKSQILQLVPFLQKYWKNRLPHERNEDGAEQPFQPKELTASSSSPSDEAKLQDIFEDFMASQECYRWEALCREVGHHFPLQDLLILEDDRGSASASFSTRPGRADSWFDATSPDTMMEKIRAKTQSFSLGPFDFCAPTTPRTNPDNESQFQPDYFGSSGLDLMRNSRSSSHSRASSRSSDGFRAHFSPTSGMPAPSPNSNYRGD